MMSATPAISAASPAISTNSRSAMASLGVRRLRRRLRNLQARREQRGERKRRPDAGNTGGPAQAVGCLAEYRGGDEAPREIASEVNAARRAPVGGRVPGDETRSSCLP